MSLHPTLLRRATEARESTASRTRLVRVGHYSNDPSTLRRQVQELERRVADSQEELARKVEE